jgi:predicted site-specific integrase-resolvase
VVTDVGSVLNGERRTFVALPPVLGVTTIIVEYRDQCARLGAESVEAALAASGRGLLVADPVEVDDDVVWDVMEILICLCARLYGRRAAAGRAARAMAVMSQGQP